MRKMLITLTLVMILSGLVLAATFQGLTGRIEENRAAALNASLAAVFGGTSNATFAELPAGDDATIYRGTASGGETLGYAVQLGAQGYGGQISLLVGLSPDLSQILAIEVVEHVETPGLGGRITEDDFREQFAGLRADVDLSYVKNIPPDPAANEVQAISGATITSKAIVTGVNEGLATAITTIEGAR